MIRRGIESHINFRTAAEPAELVVEVVKHDTSNRSKLALRPPRMESLSTDHAAKLCPLNALQRRRVLHHSGLFTSLLITPVTTSLHYYHPISNLPCTNSALSLQCLRLPTWKDQMT